LLYALILCSVAIIAGCGGGGGATSGQPSQLAPGGCSVNTPLGTIQYSTFWGSAPALASQVVQVIDGDGFTLRADTVQRNGELSSSITLANVVAGVHILKVRIYSGANATGQLLGESSQVVNLCGTSGAGVTAQASVKYGSSPAALVVAPGSYTIADESTVQFVATGVDANGAVFLPVNDLTWSVGGGIGSISSVTGQFSAQTVGTGSITATAGTSGLTGSAAVEVTPRTTTQGKWTVLVYLNAANDLFSFSTLNVNQMEEVAGNADVRFVVQWKQSKSVFGASTFDGVRRYLVKPDSSSAIASELVQANLRDSGGNALDMGDPQTLNDFIKWGKANYPADRYCLVLWNHGNGWKRSIESGGQTRAFSYDDQYGTSIKSWETDQALAGETFDIIAWDCSLMQMMEVAYEIRSFTDYVVGSEESPPGEGYPYHRIFDDFRDNPNASTLSLANAFVAGMQQNSLPGEPYQFRKITQSVVDTSKLNGVATALSVLANELITHRTTIAADVQVVRNTSQSYSPTTGRVYRDLVDVCFGLEGSSSVPISTKNASSALRTALAQAIVGEYHNNQSAKSNGLSIDFSAAFDYAAYRSDYIRMKIAQDTQWDNWLEVSP
jgi:hypothetical protein